MSDPRPYPPARARSTPRRAVDFAAELNEAQRAAATARRRPAAHRRRRRHGQDAHARLPRRASHRAGRPAGTDPPAHLHAPRRAGDARPRRAPRREQRAAACTAAPSTAPRIACCAASAPRRDSPATSPSSTRADAEDLMQLSRAGAGVADKTKRFPKKATLHHVYSRHVNTEIPVGAILREEYPQFVEFEEEIAKVFADYTARKQARNLVDYDDLLLFWAMLRRVGAGARDRRPDRRALRPHPRRRVPGHQRAAGAHPQGDVPRAPEPHGGRRRRAEHLRVPRRDHPQHPRLPARVSPAPRS